MVKKNLRSISPPDLRDHPKRHASPQETGRFRATNPNSSGKAATGYHLSSPTHAAAEAAKAREKAVKAAAGAVVQRARELCKGHGVPNVSGCCRQCFGRAVEEYLLDQHPEMRRGDVFDLVQEWLLRAGEPSH